jgi:hypothetical protein
MWDVMLTLRHQAGGAAMFGVATDDAHDYRTYHENVSMPGRGWVMVRSERLTPELIVAALAAGDFYSSTGVTLQNLRRDARGISITIKSEAGVNYTTQFIGTRRSAGTSGVTLAEVSGTTAQYKFVGDERYVRAVVISSKLRIDPVSGDALEFERAWIQPVMR